MFRWFLLAAVLLLALWPTPVSAAECRFVLGFQAVHNAIPEVVGACLVDEHYGANGDALQETANGLLVWRKADNFTAFTDGYRTWVLGPYGIQQRLNTERFPWEAGYTAPAARAAISRYAAEIQPILEDLVPAVQLLDIWTGSPPMSDAVRKARWQASMSEFGSRIFRIELRLISVRPPAEAQEVHSLLKQSLSLYSQASTKTMFALIVSDWARVREGLAIFEEGTSLLGRASEALRRY